MLARDFIHLTGTALIAHKLRSLLTIVNLYW